MSDLPFTVLAPYSMPGSSSCQSDPFPEETPPSGDCHTVTMGSQTYCRKLAAHVDALPRSKADTTISAAVRAEDTGPNPTPLARKRSLRCPSGQLKCPRLSGRGGDECIDVKRDAQNCGGCNAALSGLGNPTGQDCTSIPNVNIARCVKGRCKIGRQFVGPFVNRLA